MHRMYVLPSRSHSREHMHSFGRHLLHRLSGRPLPHWDDDINVRVMHSMRRRPIRTRWFDHKLMRRVVRRWAVLCLGYGCRPRRSRLHPLCGRAVWRRWLYHEWVLWELRCWSILNVQRAGGAIGE